MGTDTTPPEPGRPNDSKAPPRHPSDRVRKAVANDNTNGAPRPQQAPGPSPDVIVLPIPAPK